MNQELLRVGEAAKVLNVSRWTIYRWVEEDRLKATKIGKGSLRIFRASIDTLVEHNRKDHWNPLHTVIDHPQHDDVASISKRL